MYKYLTQFFVISNLRPHLFNVNDDQIKLNQCMHVLCLSVSHISQSLLRYFEAFAVHVNPSLIGLVGETPKKREDLEVQHNAQNVVCL